MYGFAESSNHDETSVTCFPDAFASDIESDNTFNGPTGVASGVVDPNDEEDIFTTNDVDLDRNEMQHAQGVDDLSTELPVNVQVSSAQREELPGPMPGSFVYENEPQACDIIEMSCTTTVQDNEVTSETLPSISVIEPRGTFKEGFVPPVSTPHEDPMMPESPSKSPTDALPSNQSYDAAPAEVLESDSWTREGMKSKEDATRGSSYIVTALDTSNLPVSGDNVLESSTLPVPVSAIDEWTSAVDKKKEQKDFNDLSARAGEPNVGAEQQVVSKEKIADNDEMTLGSPGNENGGDGLLPSFDKVYSLILPQIY